MRFRLAICALLIGIGGADAQGPDARRPIRLAQTSQSQTFTSCLLNCDTRSGTCQGSCGVGNSPSTTFATPTTGSRPDPGALAQCYLTCTTQQLSCKQACNIR